MKRFFFFLTIVFISTPLFAQQLQIKLWLNTSGLYIEDSEYMDDPEETRKELLEEGWRKANEEEDEYGFIFEKTYEVNSLPWHESKGKFHLSILKDGVARIGFSYGDSDGGAHAETQLPLKDGQVMKSDKPYFLNLNGGEHASGMWQAHVKLGIEVLE